MIITETYEINDFPKLQSPFVREKITGKKFIVTDEIAEGFEWVFNDPDVLAIEKLDGTNVSIYIENGIVKSIWNRKNLVPHITGNRYILEGLIESANKKYLPKTDGQFFGELIGKKVQSNPYDLDATIWIPFSYLINKCQYPSYPKSPKDFDYISLWFKQIPSLFADRRGVSTFAEGVVFHQLSTGKMAKLRRDMFDWYWV